MNIDRIRFFSTGYYFLDLKYTFLHNFILKKKSKNSQNKAALLPQDITTLKFSYLEKNAIFRISLKRRIFWFAENPCFG